MDNARARQVFQELRAEESGVSPAVLDEVWAALETVDVSEILGSWRGAAFATGHRVAGMLTSSPWYGKRFISALDAQPMVCRGEDGELYSNIEMGNGEASLWNIEFRGEVTATIVYDGRPIFDHFKRVDENTLMGIMNGKAKFALDDGQHCYFLLERD